jgi:tetratricopeptide (TPR) repeat protein
MRYPRALLAIVLTGAIGAGLPASTSFAAADETSAAREHAQKGKAFMDLGKYNEAAAEYEAAYAEKQDPTLLLNLAQAYRMAGNGNKAVFFYRKYLQHVPKSPYRADIEDKIATLEKSGATGSVAPPPVGETPTTPPAPPTVPPNPPSPPPGPTTAGSGSNPPGPPGAPPADPIVAPTPPPPPIPPPGALSEAAPTDHGKNLRLAGMVTGGAGLLSYVVAAIFGGQAKDAQRNVEKTANSGGTFDPNEDQRGRSAQTKEVTFIIVGTAALAAGGVIYYLGTRHPAETGSPPPGSVALMPSVAPDRMGAALRVTF